MRRSFLICLTCIVSVNVGYSQKDTSDAVPKPGAATEKVATAQNEKAPDPANSQSQFSITGEIRPRAEFRNGYKRLHNKNDDPAFFTEQRSRLYFDYTSEKLKFLLSLQDVRVWGNVDQVFKSDPTLHNIREAWSEYHFSKPFSVKLGRQSLSYDNERFLGALEWVQQGRAHDALLLKLENDSGRCQLHLGGAFNQNILAEPTKLSGTFYGGVNNYKTMQFAWFHKMYARSKFSILLLNEGRQRAQDSTVKYIQTYGFYGQKKLWNALRLTGEFYYQMGKTVSNTDLSAYLAAVQLNFFEAGKVPLTLGTDYLSGTNPNGTKNHSFDPSYGTNHNFYGYMDYFYVGNPHGQNSKIAGLADIFIKASFKISKKSLLKTDLHQFFTTAKVSDPLNPAGNLSKNLGIESDLVYTLTVSPVVVLNVGYSQMFGTNSLEAVKGNSGDKGLLNNWAWLMIAIKPVFFQHKNK